MATENLFLCKIQLKNVGSYKNTELLKEPNKLFFKYMKPLSRQHYILAITMLVTSPTSNLDQ